MEFVTSGTRDTRVKYFWARVKFYKELTQKISDGVDKNPFASEVQTTKNTLPVKFGILLM